MKLLKGILLYVGMISFSSLSSQAPHIKHFTLDDGLPTSNIYRVLQDSKGFLWICSQAGIARFNGYYFEAFGGNEYGLPYNDFWEIKEDSKGRIWFSTYATHFIYYDYTDKIFHVKENNLLIKNKGQPAFLQLEDSTGGVWYRSTYYLYYSEKDSLIDFSQFKGFWRNGLNVGVSRYRLMKEFVIEKRVNHNNQYYNGITTQKQPYDTYLTYQDSFPCSASVNPIVSLDEHSYLCFDVGKQILHFRSPYTKKQVLLEEMCKLSFKPESLKIVPINPAEILVAAGNETWVIDTNLHRIHQYDFLKNWEINSICDDQENNRWITTPNDGIYLLTADALESHTFSPFQGSHDIRAITSDNTGRIWIGTSQGEVYYLAGDSLVKLYFHIPFNVNIRDMIFTPSQTMLIAYNGFTVVYPLTLLPVNSRNIEINVATYSNTVDYGFTTSAPKIFFLVGQKVLILNRFSTKNFYLKKNGNILCPVASGGNYLELSEVKNQQHYSQFYVNHRIVACVPVKQNEEYTCIGTSLGLFYYQTNTATLDSLAPQKQINPILSKSIIDMATDSAGDIWVGTEGWGLYRVHSDKEPQAITVLEIEALKNKTIKSVFVDKRNHIWVATNSGAYQVSFNPNGQTAVKSYSIAQGLPTNEVNDIYVNDKYAYIATSKGLTQIPLSYTKSTYPFLLNVSSTVNGQKWAVTNPDTKFSYQENNIRFDFVSISFRSDKKVKYHYRIRKDGEDSKWLITEELYKEFPLLPPSNYEFEIKAEDIDGTLTEVQAIRFTISPPWWETNLFRYSFLAFIIGMVIVAALLRIRYIQREERKQTAINQKIAELELKALQAQLDEHFVFNCLNSIQSFIVKKETLIANRYLSKFANLIRLFLQSSRKKFIPISDELTIIQLFIDLELMRFESVKAEIKIENEIDMNAEIPSLLIQPYVENAFEHGFKTHEKDSYLAVNLHQKDNILYITIDDNGIGRNAAQKMKEASPNKWDSLGTKIMADRVKTLREMENMHLSIIITDKMNDKGEALGTLVEIEVEI